MGRVPGEEKQQIWEPLALRPGRSRSDSMPAESLSFKVLSVPSQHERPTQKL